MSRTFDKAQLLDRIDGDWDLLAETVEMLITDGQTLMSAIRTGIEAGDAAAVGRAAHTLKGMVSNFCSPQVQADAFDVERIGKSGNLSNASAAANALDARLKALTSELTEMLATRA